MTHAVFVFRCNFEAHLFLVFDKERRYRNHVNVEVVEVLVRGQVDWDLFVLPFSASGERRDAIAFHF